MIMESNFDRLMKKIRVAVLAVIDFQSQRVDDSFSLDEFDKMTVYKCGSRVIRIDLHTKEDMKL